MDYNRVGSATILEVGLGGHKPCMKRANTSCGSLLGDRLRLASGQWRTESQLGNSELFFEDTYFVYHINKRLSVIRGKIFEDIELITV